MQCDVSMMTSSNGNIFRVTGPLCGEFAGHRWIPLTKASDAELWCFLSVPEQTVTSKFPTQRPVTWSFDVFLDLRLNRQLSNGAAGDLRRYRAHYDVIVIKIGRCFSHYCSFVREPICNRIVGCLYVCLQRPHIDQTIELPVALVTMLFMWGHCNVVYWHLFSMLKYVEMNDMYKIPVSRSLGSKLINLYGIERDNGCSKWMSSDSFEITAHPIFVKDKLLQI